MTHRIFSAWFFAAAIAAATVFSAASARADTADDIKRIIVEEAQETDVPASLAMAIAKTGSDFRPDFTGPEGARGVMQITPETAEGFGVTPAALWQPRRNIALGMKILSHLLQRTEGDWAEAVAAYNANLFAPDGAGARRRVADTLQWERRFAEQIALQDPIQARRREVIAGNSPAYSAHDTWHDEALASDTIPDAAAGDTALSTATDHWQDDERTDRVEVVIIERIEERPVVVHAPPPPPRWRPAPPPSVRWQRAERPQRWVREARRQAREDRRFKRWVRRMAEGPRRRFSR